MTYFESFIMAILFMLAGFMIFIVAGGTLEFLRLKLRIRNNQDMNQYRKIQYLQSYQNKILLAYNDVRKERDELREENKELKELMTYLQGEI